MTKRNQNSISATPDTTFGLPKEAILRGRKNFKRLFEQPCTTFSEEHLSLRFYTVAKTEGICKVGFIAAKRLGKATKRNYLKRLMREAYRLHRHSLTETLQSSKIGFYGALVGKTVAVDFNTVEDETIRLLHRTVTHLQSSQSSP